MHSMQSLGDRVPSKEHPPLTAACSNMRMSTSLVQGYPHCQITVSESKQHLNLITNNRMLIALCAMDPAIRQMRVTFNINTFRTVMRLH